MCASLCTLRALVLASRAGGCDQECVLSQCGHGVRGWPGFEQSRRDFIDLFVGALCTEQHRDQQGEGIAVIEWNRWFRVVLIQSIQHQGSLLMLFHDLPDRLVMIAAIEQGGDIGSPAVQPWLRTTKVHSAPSRLTCER